MNRNKIRHWWNYELTDSCAEKPFGVSLTVPDQALPLKTLLDRYTRGQEVFTFDPVYLGEDEEFVDVEKMTFDERHEYLLQVNASIAAQRSSLANRRPDPVTEDQIMSEAEVIDSKPNKKSKKDDSDG